MKFIKIAKIIWMLILQHKDSVDTIYDLTVEHITWLKNVDAMLKADEDAVRKNEK